ncbi:ANK3 [Symbiodinium sp. CCMP2456]|nr:ANK3 [Symbiodinium sp. CCMP2456]
MMAVLDGYTRIAKVLLEARACLERCRADGLSPLHAAVLREATLPPRAGEASMIALLAEARADPEVRTRQGVSPLSLLMSSSVNAPHRSTALHNLIDIKADVNRPIAGDGTRPLHATVHHNLRVEAALLLERAADPNAAHDDGTAPLHLAASAGAAPFVDLLLNSRADATATTQSGQTALDLARQHGFRAIEDRLRQ